MQPGEIIVQNTEMMINENRECTVIQVKNSGDRPVQVGSHYHFFEANPALDFEREQAYAKHLDIPAGAAVRFEPGDEKEVRLIPYAGRQCIYGFHGDVDGHVDESRITPANMVEGSEVK
ncbi:urease subunit beta [Staphylococcus sp. 11261D007BR]